MALALVHREINQERLDQVTGYVADAVARNLIDKELNLLDMLYPTALYLRDAAEEGKYLTRCLLADSASLFIPG